MDGDFRVEFGIDPVGISAEAGSGIKINPAFIAAIFFGLPEVRNTFKFGNFALNQIAVKV